MMSIFNSFAASRGGVYEPHRETGSLPLRFAARQAQLRETVPSLIRQTKEWNRGLSIEVGLLSRMRPGASVKMHGNVACIGLNAGLLVSLRRVIDAGLTHSNGLVPLIPISDNGPVVLTNHVSDDIYLSLGNDDRLGLPPDSLQVADFIFDLAVEYIFYHEIRHVIDGHLDLIGQGKEMSALEDEGIARNDGLNIFDRRVLEYAADNGATSFLIATYALKMIASRTPTRQVGFVCWCIMYAVHTAHKVIEKNELNVDPKLSVHPPAAIRTHIGRINVLNCLFHATKINDELKEYVLTGFSSAEKSWHRASGTYFDQDKFANSVNATKGLVAIYNKRWARIHPTLQKLKRCEHIAERNSRLKPGGIPSKLFNYNDSNIDPRLREQS